MLLILTYDRPFTGEISIRPDPLLQVMPEIASFSLDVPPALLVRADEVIE